MYFKIGNKNPVKCKIPSNKRIFILSPHPDDAVIGLGAFLSAIIKENEVNICYLTSGFRGVKENIAVEEKIRLRRDEAINAVKILGLESRDLKFLNLPFYINGEISCEDVKILGQEVNSDLKPGEDSIDYIYVCSDFGDPHGTHYNCFKIFNFCLRKYKIDSEIYFYESIWSSFGKEETDYVFSFDHNIMEKKIKAIKAHISQLQPAYPGSEVRNPFWKKAVQKNRRERALFQKIDGGKYVELFGKK